jgi:hypothetical protein
MSTEFLIKFFGLLPGILTLTIFLRFEAGAAGPAGDDTGQTPAR